MSFTKYFNRYGSHFGWDLNGVTLIINGWWFSFRKGLNTNEWKFTRTENLWRATGRPKPEDPYKPFK